MTTLGILHPGSMGAAVAAQAKRTGTDVFWCPEGRSEATRERAHRYDLSEVRDLAEMAQRCEVILSLCPPANAEEVATAVAAESFAGIYVEGNAISPARMERISTALASRGATVVDGSVIGSPPSEVKSPQLYLSGPDDAVAAVALLFEGTAVVPHPLEGGTGKASALKLSYTSYQKSSRVLAAVSYALADDHGVGEELLAIAQGRSTSYLAETAYIPKVAARSWRWAPEMREAADALDEAGLPSDLAAASALVMERWAGSRDQKLDIGEALAKLHTAPEE
ncbi:NAD(P)-dependent oxidoreductase [Streptomyces sp. NBC_01264]|uniref:NAD(P)-dependent oxidoreductase n=1 Tax=Streptomyces sp. NBC_01264 TaxID=2903804 RepID=UPI00225A70C6|nr:NAD(P)-dependent oxidoreductase [Streptomyces sp. NBC_01264]MCX4778698.1 DUF1932 domain-containing protein [Streptomyces sp. NBC_01264]